MTQILEISKHNPLYDLVDPINNVQLEEGKPSYKNIATNSLSQSTIPAIFNYSAKEKDDYELSDDLINLSIEDKNRLYAPWRFSVIIKAFGKNFNH